MFDHDSVMSRAIRTFSTIWEQTRRDQLSQPPCVRTITSATTFNRETIRFQSYSARGEVRTSIKTHRNNAIWVAWAIVAENTNYLQSNRHMWRVHTGTPCNIKQVSPQKTQARIGDISTMYNSNLTWSCLTFKLAPAETQATSLLIATDCCPIMSAFEVGGKSRCRVSAEGEGWRGFGSVTAEVPGSWHRLNN